MREARLVLLVLSFCIPVYGGETEMPPRLGIVAAEKVQFDPNDPNFNLYYRRLETAVRYEIENDGLSEIEHYLASSDHTTLAERTYSRVRLVLAEYQVRGEPLPGNEAAVTDLLARLGMRRVPIPNVETLPGEDVLRGPEGVRARREHELHRFTVACDLAVVYPVAEILRMKAAGEVKEAASLCRERLEYLTRLARNDDGSDQPLAHAVWTPDERAQRLLCEAKSRVETDQSLADGAVANTGEALARLDELLALNEAVTKKGTVEAMVSARLTSKYWDDDRGCYVLCSLFKEYQFRRAEARAIAIEALKKLAQAYHALPKGAAERPAVLRRAEDVYNAFYECGVRNEDISQQALGRGHSDDDRWLEGER